MDRMIKLGLDLNVELSVNHHSDGRFKEAHDTSREIIETILRLAGIRGVANIYWLENANSTARFHIVHQSDRMFRFFVGSPENNSQLRYVYCVVLSTLPEGCNGEETAQQIQAQADRFQDVSSLKEFRDRTNSLSSLCQKNKKERDYQITLPLELGRTDHKMKKVYQAFMGDMHPLVYLAAAIKESSPRACHEVMSEFWRDLTRDDSPTLAGWVGEQRLIAADGDTYDIKPLNLCFKILLKKKMLEVRDISGLRCYRYPGLEYPLELSAVTIEFLYEMTHPKDRGKFSAADVAIALKEIKQYKIISRSADGQSLLFKPGQYVNFDNGTLWLEIFESCSVYHSLHECLLDRCEAYMNEVSLHKEVESLHSEEIGIERKIQDLSEQLALLRLRSEEIRKKEKEKRGRIKISTPDL